MTDLVGPALLIFTGCLIDADRKKLAEERRRLADKLTTEVRSPLMKQFTEEKLIPIGPMASLDEVIAALSTNTGENP